MEYLSHISTKKISQESPLSCKVHFVWVELPNSLKQHRVCYNCPIFCSIHGIGEISLFILSSLTVRSIYHILADKADTCWGIYMGKRLLTFILTIIPSFIQNNENCIKITVSIKIHESHMRHAIKTYENLQVGSYSK